MHFIGNHYVEFDGSVQRSQWAQSCQGLRQGLPQLPRGYPIGIKATALTFSGRLRISLTDRFSTGLIGE